MAKEPDSSQFSILGLAYESGFNSKTVFNTYFKKETGLTPKAWIQKQ
ncbi:MAG: helix-turn-helix domain-containing protein [Crocinitomicaceae bacterium]